MKIGIDVSKHNGEINWKKVQPQIDFAMLRAGYGQKTEDSSFRMSATACNNLKIPIGIYWFSYALSTSDAIQEAKKCIETIKNYDITYPVAYDFEGDSIRYAIEKGVELSDEDISQMAQAFLDTVKDAGYKAILYTNPSMLKSYFKHVSGYPVWLAYWTKEKQSDYAMWQYTEKGNIPGIEGFVDLNRCYWDYEMNCNEKPSDWAEDAWQWAKTMKLNDGLGAKNLMTEEQAMVFLKRFYKRFIEPMHH